MSRISEFEVSRLRSEWLWRSCDNGKVLRFCIAAAEGGQDLEDTLRTGLVNRLMLYLF